MSKNDQGGRSLAPRTGGPVEEHHDKGLRDPIAVAMEVVGSDNPSVEELVAFRRRAIDLKSAARSAKSLQSEEFRLGLFDVLEHDVQERVCAGLQILEVNPRHAMVAALATVGEVGLREDVAHLLLDTARVLDGDRPINASRFAERLARVMERSLV